MKELGKKNRILRAIIASCDGALRLLARGDGASVDWTLDRVGTNHLTITLFYGHSRLTTSSGFEQAMFDAIG